MDDGARSELVDGHGSVQLEPEVDGNGKVRLELVLGEEVEHGGGVDNRERVCHHGQRGQPCCHGQRATQPQWKSGKPCALSQVL